MTTPTLQSLTPVISPGFLAADTDPAKADWVMLGFPFDGTCSFRPGTRFGPAAVRAASQGVETYSPRQDRDLEDLNFADMGDLDLAIGDAAKALEQIETAAASVLAEGKKLVGIGGEHLVSYPLIKAAFEQYPDLKVVQFDAHADLRDSYLDTGLSHPCVMRRVVELLRPEALLQVGIRSGTRDEFAWMKENKTLMASFEQFHSRLLWLKTNTPIYLTMTWTSSTPVSCRARHPRARRLR
ncbi:MAG: agmatinase [Vampirovibrionales bacterium]